VTFDEAGGYWRSSYIQPLDFYGDGPRAPFIVVSPYPWGGAVVRTYFDHVSVLKFIERNRSLKRLTSRSRDNLPNPIANAGDPYVFEVFEFSPARRMIADKRGEVQATAPLARNLRISAFNLRA